ncbi:MAG: FAD-binding protein [Acidobacteriota bacterium]
MSAIEKTESICRDLGITLRRGQRLSNHTAFGLGGEIDAIAYPETREVAAQLVARLEEEKIKWSALGTGSHVIAIDKPIHRVAISLKLMEELLVFNGTSVQVHGGYRIARLVTATVERGLVGLEDFATLPGTIGGAIHFDLRVQGRRITSLLERVAIAMDGRVSEIAGEEIDMHRDALILGCVLRLVEGDTANLKKTVTHRLRRQQHKVSAVGPVFRKADGTLPSRLLTGLGLKGMRCGGAAISTWDSNFIVNESAATYGELLELIEMVRDRARLQYGAELELLLDIWQ